VAGRVEAERLRKTVISSGVVMSEEIRRDVQHEMKMIGLDIAAMLAATAGKPTEQAAVLAELCKQMASLIAMASENQEHIAELCETAVGLIIPDAFRKYKAKARPSREAA